MLEMINISHNIEELIKLLQKLNFNRITVRNCTHTNGNKIEDIIDRMTCFKCIEEYYMLTTNNATYKVHMVDTNFDFIRIEFVWKNGAAVDTFVNIKDFKQKLNSYSELKSLIRKNKIKNILQ